MLFHKLYNWIKYKTLPPSVLFKNRLFIERDVKHKKIVNNFGLVFRSSKWSNYENYNIHSSFKNYYLNSLYFSLVIFFCIFLLSHYSLLNSYYLNNFFFIFWMSLDSFDYYLSFLVWSFSALISSLFTSFYYFFIFKDSPVPAKKLSTRSDDAKNLNFSKSDLNWILYSWLNNTNKLQQSKVAEILFNSEISNKWWNENFDFFARLFKVNYFLGLLSERQNSFSLSLSLNSISNKNFQIDKFLIFSDNSYCLNQFGNYVLSFYFKNYINYFDSKISKSSSTSSLRSRFAGNLHQIDTELSNNNPQLLFKAGSFVLNDLSQRFLISSLSNFPEIWNLNSFLNNQNKLAKWNRWLYKYSILHRKILKNSHKLILTKKLLNSGFYSKNFFDKNIWNSSNFKKLALPENFLNSFLNLNYTNSANGIFPQYSAKSQQVLNFKNKEDSLNFLKIYETSYFWFLKRFYLLNGLSANSMTAKKIKFLSSVESTSIDLNLDKSLKGFSGFLSYLLKSRSFYLHDFSLVHASFQNKKFNGNNFITSFNNFSFNDISVLNSDLDVLNKDNLNILSYLTSTYTETNLNFLYFSHLNSFSQNNFKSRTNNFYSYPRNTSSVRLFKKILITSLINSDSFYEKDLYHMSFFI